MLWDFVCVKGRKQLRYYRFLQGHGEHLNLSESDFRDDAQYIIFWEFLKGTTSSEISTQPKRTSALIKSK